jgi:hypothetical protein
MRQQAVSNSQSANNAAEASQLNNEWGPRVDNHTHTRIASLPAKAWSKPSTLACPLQTTLLDVICAVNEMIDDEQLVVATVAHLVNTHRVRLTGTFKNTTIVIS